MQNYFPPDLTKIENFSYVRELARGHYGIVSLVQNRITKEQLALKVLEIPKKIDVWTQVKESLQMMQQFQDYRSLVSIINFQYEKIRTPRRLGIRANRKVFLLTELCQCNLIQDIRKRYSMSKTQRKYFTEEELLNILCPIVIMLSEFQTKGVAHRNIRINNFLRGFDGQYKLSGLGYIQKIVKTTKPYAKKFHWKLSGTKYIPSHFSPERIDAWCDDYKDIDEEYIYKADVYSLGLVILQAGKLDLQIEPDKEAFKEIYSTALSAIVEKMLERDPVQRPDFQQLLELLEQEGLMQQRLQVFKQVEKLFKFHGIDKAVVNNLRKKIKDKKSKISVLRQEIQAMEGEPIVEKDKKSFNQLSHNTKKLLVIQEEETAQNFQPKIYQKIQVQPENLCHLITALKHNIKLEEIILDLRFFEDVKGEMDQIGTLLKDHLMLKKLDVDLEAYENKSRSQIQDMMRLFTNLHTLKNLTSIKLNFDSSRISNDDLSTICKKLIQLPDVAELAINMSEIGLCFDKGLSSIGNAITSLEDIDSIRINVQNTTTTEHGLMQIAQCLKEKPNLSQLALGFGETQQKNESGILCLAEAVNGMRKLLNLHISLEGTDIEQVGQTKLFQSLTNLRLLQVLKLNFGRCEIKNDGPLEALAMSISSMSYLQELSAEFFDCNISDQAFNKLSQSLYDKQKLKILALGFGKTKLREEETLQKFSKALTQLSALCELSIVLYKTKLTDEAIEHLCKALNKMQNLTNLVLTFGKTKIEGDKALNSLANSLKSMKPTLKVFELYVQKTQTTEVAFAALSKALARHKKLEELALNFGHTRQQSDEGLLQLAETIVKLNHLTKFHIVVFGKINITKKGLDSIVDAIEQNEEIKEIQCRIQSTQLKDSQIKDVVKKLETLISDRSHLDF